MTLLAEISAVRFTRFCPPFTRWWAAILTPIGDVEALVMNMERLVVEKTLAPPLSEAARRRVEQVYDMAKISPQFLTLSRQLSKESQPLR